MAAQTQAPKRVSNEQGIKSPEKPETLVPQVSAGMENLQRVVANPRAARPADILALQRQYGNTAVQRLLAHHHIQAKLTVGAAHDAYEQEADHVAAQVMSAPEQAPKVQRLDEEDEEEEIQARPLAASITPLVQREAAPEEDEVQAKPGTDSTFSPDTKAVQHAQLIQRVDAIGIQTLTGLGLTIDVLKNAADAIDKAPLTKAGRALAKHSVRPGSLFGPEVKANPQTKNALGRQYVDEILDSPTSTVSARVAGRFGNVVDVQIPGGRGVRFTQTGQMIGFLEP